MSGFFGNPYIVTGTLSLTTPSVNNLIVGGSTPVTGLTTAPVEIQSNGSAVDSLKIVGYSTVAANGAYISIGRTKSSAPNTNTIVASGDMIGSYVFLGANGTSYTPCAEMKVIVDGTPGASNDMPGRFEFYTTPDGSGTQLRRWDINAVGALSQNATNGGLLVFNRANTTINFAGTMGTSTKAPQTVANDGWIEVQVAGVAKYIPYYNAS